jgi:hypothetical protein
MPPEPPPANTGRRRCADSASTRRISSTAVRRMAVVNRYDQLFSLHVTDAQKADLDAADGTTSTRLSRHRLRASTRPIGESMTRPRS